MPDAPDMPAIVKAVRSSENFKSELRYIRRGGYDVTDEPGLFKHLERGLVRVVFPTTVARVDAGTVVALVCLYDTGEQVNVYAHTICAGPGVNALLKAVHSQMPVALPQPGATGEAAIAKFVAWKEAAWTRFLNDELEFGSDAASATWISGFWRALDRMFGGGFLTDPGRTVARQAALP